MVTVYKLQKNGLTCSIPDNVSNILKPIHPSYKACYSSHKRICMYIYAYKYAHPRISMRIHALIYMHQNIYVHL